jgi:hypothetical protein
VSPDTVGTFLLEMDSTVGYNSLSQHGVAWVADVTPASHIMPHVGSKYLSLKGCDNGQGLVLGRCVEGGITGS